MSSNITDETIDSFCAITGATKDRARFFLEASNGDIEVKNKKFNFCVTITFFLECYRQLLWGRWWKWFNRTNGISSSSRYEWRGWRRWWL